MSQDEVIIKDWERRKYDELAYKDGLNFAKEQGINERNLEIARNLLHENVDIEIIAKTTGLSKEEIKSLSENKE